MNGRDVRASGWVAVAGAIAVAAGGLPALAQVQAVDPDAAFKDVAAGTPPAPVTSVAPPQQSATQARPAAAQQPRRAEPGFDLAGRAPQPAAPARPQPGALHSTTYRNEDLVNAAQGVFGKGARDVAVAIGDVLKKQGEPNGYIVGSEGGGAFIFGLRYGSGTLHQKTAPPRPVYWSGPSIGFDAGAAGGNTFVLVYNLADQETLFTRFGAGEGQAYVIGGVHVSYLRHGNMVLIPVRMGVGLRLGVNAGYMKFSRRQNWLPF